MEKKEQLYEGKAKKVFATDDPTIVIWSTTRTMPPHGDGEEGHHPRQGRHQQPMTNNLMKMLEKQGIPTHFVKELTDRETLVKKVPSFLWRSSSATSPPAPSPSATAWRRASS